MNMKRILTLLFVFAALVTSAQKKETRSVDTFTKIAFRVPGKVYVRQGTPQRVEIEGDKEMLEKIKTRVEDGKLTIGPEESDRWFNWDWNDDDRVTVYITVQNIEGLSVSGSGDMIAQTKITSNRLDLAVSGSGSLEAEVDAGNVKLSVSGSGDLVLRGKCGNVESAVSGSGDINLNVNISDRADFSISGSGKVIASGTAKKLEVGITGSGKVLASGFQVLSCLARISGSGDLEIHVIEELDARISGSGTVTYKGDPSHVNSNASGSGSVRKM
jgi:hypothetical protein